MYGGKGSKFTLVGSYLQVKLVKGQWKIPTACQTGWVALFGEKSRMNAWLK